MKQFLFFFSIFVALNICLYGFIIHYHSKISFSKKNYISVHHYKNDPQYKNLGFDLLKGLAQEDAQWYLKIADSGYPSHPKNANLNDKKVLDGITYAFFPVYPFFIFLFHQVIPSLELSAFALSNVLLIINYLSLYYVITKLFNKIIAVKTIFLLFTFPFSIFYRSYFTEGLYLFFLIWFSYFFVKNKLIAASLFLGILNVTKINSYLLNIVYIYYLFKTISIKKHTIVIIASLFFLCCPFGVWLLFNYFQTGNFFYFSFIQSLWYPPLFWMYAFLRNIALLIVFYFLPFHTLSYSKVDITVAIFSAILLYKSKHAIMKKLWLVSFLLWISPLLVKDFSSFSRYQIVSFPCFIYLAMILKNKWNFLLVECIFVVLLCITAIFFVNWYWVG